MLLEVPIWCFVTVVVVVDDVAVNIVAVGVVIVVESLGKVFEDIMMNLEKLYVYVYENVFILCFLLLSLILFLSNSKILSKHNFNVALKLSVIPGESEVSAHSLNALHKNR